MNAELLRKRLAALQEQRETLWAQVHQVTGAIEQLRWTLAELERPDPAGPDDEGDTPPEALPVVVPPPAD